MTQENADELREAVAGTGIDDASSPVVTTSGDSSILVQTEELTDEESDKVTRRDRRRPSASTPERHLPGPRSAPAGARRSRSGRCSASPSSWCSWSSSSGPTSESGRCPSPPWSRWPTTCVITVGIYALSGFEVTPATVTGLLTILGFSLYDTVVVFDKVRENTKDLRATRKTYAEAANLAVNQTLVRSINTSIVALIPVGAILYVSAVQLGSGSLKDLALALFVGMAAGAYSSIFIATPLLVHLKSSETEVVLAERRAKARERAQGRPLRLGAVVQGGHAGRRRPGGRAGWRPLVDDRDDLDDDEPDARHAAPSASRRPRAAAASYRPPQRRSSRAPASGRQQPTRQPKSKRGKK